MITSSTSSIVLLFVCRSRLAWKLRIKQNSLAKSKNDHIRNAISLREFTQKFWDSVLPLIAERIHEFSLRQILDLLRSASKPFVGKKSVVRILAGFATEAIRHLEKMTPSHPDFEPSLETLQELIPALFQKQELRQTIEEQLNSAAANSRDHK